MKRIALFLLLVSFKIESQTIESQRPKLVVGIVVDQMRYDYLTRFYNKFGDGGFKRLMNDGFNCENNHYNYVPTYTAVGHASIYSGTTPNNHGIIGNWWYDKYVKKSIYCVDDVRYNGVGSNTSRGKKSPYRMKVTTITDQLRLAQNMKGKTISIALKDRSSILPGGFTANASYWYDYKDNGKWISSTFYMNELPTWVQEFNDLKKPDYYLSKPWNTLYSIDSYNSIDNNVNEGKFIGEEAPVFPHELPKLKKHNNDYELLNATPFGNTFTIDFAKQAILKEGLGKDEHSDFLTISFSSTDYVGHQFGVNAVETEDTYLRLDKELEQFLIFLDKEVGTNEYTLFLTADHGVAEIPSYLKNFKIPAGNFDTKGFKEFVSKIAIEKFKSDSLIENFSNFQLFLNTSEIGRLNLNGNQVMHTLVNEIINFKDVYKVVSAQTMQNTYFSEGILHLVQNGYNQKISGDILVIPNPGYIGSVHDVSKTTHGSGYNYDTHVPLLFYGKGIKKGSIKKRTTITDIAPTMSMLLKIGFPNGSSGSVITEALD